MTRYDCPKKGVGGPCTIRKLSEVYWENTTRSGNWTVRTDLGEKTAPPPSPEISPWWYLAPVCFILPLFFIPIPKRTKLLALGFLAAYAIGALLITIFPTAFNGFTAQSQQPLITTNPILAIILVMLGVIMIAYCLTCVWLFYCGLIDWQKRRRIQYQVLFDIWNNQYYCVTHGNIIDPI